MAAVGMMDVEDEDENEKNLSDQEIISRHVSNLVSTVIIHEAQHQQKQLKSGSVVSALYAEIDLSESGGIEVLDKVNNSKLNLFIVNNDGSENALVWLVSMKEIFARQLPKMPKEYIIRLCFDQNHFTLCCVRTDLSTNRKEVIGGICFRPFLDQRFAEIAFLAVSADHQVSGYGTIIMNHLKHYIQTIDTTDKDWKRHLTNYKEVLSVPVASHLKRVEDIVNTHSKFLVAPKGTPARFAYITHFLTYADNFAIGYFQKQGFTKEITIPGYRYQGFIKDYDGGTLMECEIIPYINYLNVKEIIREQKQYLMKKLQERYEQQPIYPGLGVQKALREIRDKTGIFEDDEKHSKHVSVYDIPGVREAGWFEGVYNKLLSSHPTLNFKSKIKDPILVLLHEMLNDLLQKLKKHDEAWCFLEPVPDTVVDYIDVVNDPVDLSLIQKRLNSCNKYKSIDDFKDDLAKMYDNCRLYNLPESDYYKSADALQAFSDPLLKAMADEFEEKSQELSPSRSPRLAKIQKLT